MRLNSLAHVGGLNSLENFARSWQRAAGFNELPSRRPAFIISADDEEEGIGTRRSEPSPTEQRSLLRQQLERQESVSQAVIDDVPTTPADSQKQAPARSLDVRETDVVDRAPYLASPYASNYGGIYGSLSSRVNESSLQHAGRLFDEQQLAGVGEPDKEDEPLLIRRTEQEDGKIIEEVIGRSTLPQTILNSVNVLVGVGILSLPLALRYSGWVIGILFLLSAALVTRYTAGLLAKCLNQFPRMTHFSELGSTAFGVRTRVAVEILITLELAAACVALVVLFADSLNALIPGWGIVEWKIVCGVIILPLNFVPLRSRPIISSADKLLGLDARSVASPPPLAGLPGYSRGLLRSAVRVVVTIVILVIAIVVPSFDTVMSLMGSALCFAICIILPVAFYLRIFGKEISKKEKVFDWFMIVVSAVMGIIGTVWTVTKNVFTLDLLVDRESNYPDLLICGELYLSVCHCLVGHSSNEHVLDKDDQMSTRGNLEQPHPRATNFSHISAVYSHPQALGQCERFLALHLPGAEKQDFSSTSKAAEKVAEEGPDSKAVAISSSLAAEVNGLKVLAKGIQDRNDNSTRFFILKSRETKQERHDPSPHQPFSADAPKWRTLISFALPQQPSGTLADVLQTFKDRELNLTGIHSRPSLEQAWHYVFLIEVQGKREADGAGMMNEALDELGRKTKGWRWLGSWIDQAEKQVVAV
ncbi:MAG: hypothetical protein Q9225_005641 [Loekoesia sp. 1 TL-2023]